MKTKNSLALLLLFLIAALIVSCRKDHDQKPIIVSSNDLLNYYIVLRSKSDILNVMYFVQGANGIEMYRDTHSSRRVRTMSAMDAEGHYTFDVNNDGKNVFHFKFQKKANGTVILAESYNKIEGSDDNNIAHIQFENLSGVPDYRTSQYNWYGDVAPTWDFIRFISPEVMRVRYNTAPNTNDMEIDDLLGNPEKPIGWKEKIGGIDYFGVVVSEWGGEKKPFMLMQSSNQTILWQFLRQ